MESGADWVRLAKLKTRSGTVSERSFSSLFGNPSVVLPAIWRHVRVPFAGAALRAFHLLWLLYWLKVYPTFDQGCVFWKTDKDTFRGKVLFALLVVHESLPDVRSLIVLLAHVFLQQNSPHSNIL